MKKSGTVLEPQWFEGRDGARLAYREIGAGRPVVLLHGYFSTATVNWIRYGHAEEIAARGRRVIMPDLRAHGDSAKSHDASAYPYDVLTDDAFALLDHLGIDAGDPAAYDLGGYSLGARTVLRMLARGAKPGRAVVAGTGTTGVLDTSGRGEHFRHLLNNLGTFEQGTPEWRSEAFLKTVGGDPVALLHLLDAFSATPLESLAQIDTPVLVLVGADDDIIGSTHDLVEALPHARHQVVPGTHMGAVVKPPLGLAIADYLESSAP